MKTSVFVCDEELLEALSLAIITETEHLQKPSLTAKKTHVNSLGPKKTNKSPEINPLIKEIKVL